MVEHGLSGYSTLRHRGGGRYWGRRGRGRGDGGVRCGSVDLESAGDVAIESVTSLEEVVDSTQEGPGLRALNDAVIVRAGDRHDPRASHIPDGPGGDDRSLSPHEPGNRSGGSERAGVGKRDGAALVGVRHQLSISRAGNEPLVLCVKLREGLRIRVLDYGNEEPPLPVFAFRIDGQTEVDRSRIKSVTVTVILYDRLHHRGKVLAGEHNRPTHEMGERQLLSACFELTIECCSDSPELGNVDVTIRRCGRNAEARFHVLKQAKRWALDGFLHPSAHGRSWGGRWSRRGSRGSLRLLHWLFTLQPVLEKLAPFGRHGFRVAQEILVQGLREAGVDGFEDIVEHGVRPRAKSRALRKITDWIGYCVSFEGP